jgi:SAM-dependent methyltransferase
VQRILNVGCGARPSPNTINVDWSPYIRLATHPGIARIVRVFLTPTRRERLDAFAGQAVAHDLRKGLPFDTDSATAVYASHFLEHLDREDAPGFLAEAFRVLEPDGYIRLVVPDLELLCLAYIDTLPDPDTEVTLAEDHDLAIEALLEQSVRRESAALTEARARRRKVERMLLGDARQKGETHQWMYDRINLPALLTSIGFIEPEVLSYKESGIPGWDKVVLDERHDGSEYKPGSLYVEARKPPA